MKQRMCWLIVGISGCPKGRESGDSVVVETGESGDSTIVETGETGDSVDTGVTDTTKYVDVQETAWLTVNKTGGNDDWFGRPVSLGDVTGDGMGDVCFNALDSPSDACYGFRSPVRSGEVSYDEADFIVSTDTNQPDVGTPGDVNGDGVDDVQMGPYVYLGPLDDTESPETADIRFVVDELAWIAYSLQSNPGDSDGDGVEDTLINFFEIVPDKAISEEPLMLYSGLEAGEVSMEEATAWFHLAESFRTSSVYSYGYAGDTNGDGFDDVVVLSAFRGIDIYLGPPASDVYESDTIMLLESRYAAMGDVNDDGYDDLAAARRVCGEGDVCAGILFGPFDEEEETEGAEVRFVLEGSKDGDGVESIANAGDTNGDGLPDVAMIMWRGEEPTASDTTLYLFETPMEGSITEEDAALESADAFSLAILDGPADLNGDGATDLLIGDCGGRGTGWVLLGGTF